MQKSGILIAVLLLVLLVLPVSSSIGITPTGETITNLSRVLPSDTGEIRDFYDQVGPFAFNSASSGYLISEFVVDYEPGQAGDYIIHLNDGSTITGRVDYQVSYLGFWENFYFSLGEAEHTFTGLAAAFTKKTMVIGYLVKDPGTENQQYYIAMWRSGIFWGFYEDPAILYPITDRPSLNPIIQVDVTPTGTIGRWSVYVHTTSDEMQAENTVENNLNWSAWVTNLVTLVGSIWTALMTIWGVFSFVFIENLLLTLLLVEGAVLAYHLSSSRNIFVAFSRVGQTNVYIFRFILEAINYLIGFLHQVIDSLKPI